MSDGQMRVMPDAGDAWDCSTPERMDLLERPPALATLDRDAFNALGISGGTAPIFAFRANQNLHPVAELPARLLIEAPGH